MRDGHGPPVDRAGRRGRAPASPPPLVAERATTWPACATRPWWSRRSPTAAERAPTSPRSTPLNFPADALAGRARWRWSTSASSPTSSRWRCAARRGLGRGGRRRGRRRCSHLRAGRRQRAALRRRPDRPHARRRPRPAPEDACRVLDTRRPRSPRVAVAADIEGRALRRGPRHRQRVQGDPKHARPSPCGSTWRSATTRGTRGSLVAPRAGARGALGSGGRPTEEAPWTTIA